MITDNVYTLFTDIDPDKHVINNNEFILLPHQVIPKYYVISESDVNTLILHYSLGSGKTATAVFILLHYLNLYRMYDFMNHFARLDSSFMQKHRIHHNVIVVGAWQTQSQIETELLRPEFGIIKSSDTNEMRQWLSSSIIEIRQKGEEKRKRLIHEIDKDIRFCGYQSFFNLMFPTVKSESYGQNVNTLISEYESGNIEISKDFLDSYRNSIIIIDEMQRLYSIDGLNSFGVSVMILTKIAKRYNIKIVFLTGTMINSSVREIVDIMNILSTKEKYDYDDYVVPYVSKDGISVMKIKPEKHDEIVKFFERKFMYYNQSSDKVVDIPKLLSFKELSDMMKVAIDIMSGKSEKKKPSMTGGMELMNGIYTNVSSSSDSDSDDSDSDESSSDDNYDALKAAIRNLRYNSEIDDEIKRNMNGLINDALGADDIDAIANGSIANGINSDTSPPDPTPDVSPDDEVELVDTDTIDIGIVNDPNKPIVTESSEPTIIDIPNSALSDLPFTKFNQVFIPEFIRADRKMQYMVYPYVDLIPQEIHVGNTPLNDPTALQPMLIYAITTEGHQAKAYAQYISNYLNQHEEFDDTQSSESTIYIQDAYIPPPEEWMKYGIIRDANGNLYGKFLHIDNIRQFSAIGYEMLRLCFENSFAGEKTILYHNKLNAFGINQYALILHYNGFVRYGQTPVDKSICRECRHTYSDHHQSLDYRTTHRICNTFKPICYAVLSGALQQFERDNLTNNIFNNPNNLYGDLISIMFVSDVAYSGVSFFNTNNIIILSRIPNISKWKQIYSRIIRTRSHMGLPPTKQYAKVYTLTIDYPNELQKWKSPVGFTVGSLYYKQREVANEDIKMITQDIAKTCISSVLFSHPETYKSSDVAVNISNELLRTDIKENMELILRRIMYDKLCTTWFIGTFIRRLKDPKVSVSFINLRPIDKDILTNIISESRRTTLFTYIDERTHQPSNTKYIKYNVPVDVKSEVYTTFDVSEFSALKVATANIKNLIKKLDTDTSIASIINHLSRILKLCKKNYMPVVNSLTFWEQMYELGNEYYADDDVNFIHNHTRAGRNKATFVGCYYGNEVIMKDGTSKVINYKFPMAKPKPNIPYTFKITCLVISENSPFYIHVNVVRCNKEDVNDRRRIAKGVICTSANLDDVYQYFPKLDKGLPKKNYCKELLFEVCEMQEKDDKYKFVYSPFEK